ncbi:hypothetical protein ACLKA6_001209 [Drosophila palustris]
MIRYRRVAQCQPKSERKRKQRKKETVAGNGTGASLSRSEKNTRICQAPRVTATEASSLSEGHRLRVPHGTLSPSPLASRFSQHAASPAVR